MGTDTGFWNGLKTRWGVLCVVAAGAFAAGGFATDLWHTPAVATEAKELAEQNRRDLVRLQETLRIYICTQEELSHTVRIRLRCHEFD